VIRSERLELAPMTAPFLDALLGGRREEAEELLRLRLPDGWPDDHDARFLRLRLDQLRRNADAERWLVRAVVLPDGDRPMVGHAGFHGPPGVNGPGRPEALEVGYTVFEPFRGRGYATEVTRALVRWGRSEHGVRTFVASVGPWNAPSLRVVEKLGFRQVGAQWDPDDGEELVFELVVE
jgi:[ribosomal protein S5]-alanine N-acetyltransferase